MNIDPLKTRFASHRPRTTQPHSRVDLLFRITIPHQTGPLIFRELIPLYIDGKLSDRGRSDLVLACNEHGQADAATWLLEHDPPQQLVISTQLEAGQWETLLQAIPESCRIGALVLDSVDLSPVTCRLLSQVLDRMPALPSLKLNYVTMKLDEDFMPSRYGERLLRSLTLTMLKPGTCQTVARLLGPLETLQHLDLAWSRLSKQDSDSLHAMLADNTCLTHINVRGCFKNDDIVLDFAKLFKFPGIRYVDCSENMFPDKAIDRLWAGTLMALCDQQKLTHLDLAHSNLTEDAVAIVAVLLGSSRTLTSLRLPWMPDVELKPLAKAAKQNSSLRELHIDDYDDPPEPLPQEYAARHRNLLTLMACIRRNRQQHEEQEYEARRARIEQEHEARRALIHGGMKVLLSSMANNRPERGHDTVHYKPENVPNDIAWYAADKVSRQLGEDAKVLALLNAQAAGLPPRASRVISKLKPDASLTSRSREFNNLLQLYRDRQLTPERLTALIRWSCVLEERDFLHEFLVREKPTTLDLDMDFTPLVEATLSACIPQPCSITHITVRCAPHEVAAVARFSQKLELTSLCIHPYGGMLYEKDIAALLLGQRELQTLQLKSLSPGACQGAIAYLEQNTTLAQLDLSGSELTAMDCESLYQALADKTALASLSLQGCFAKSAAPKELAMLCKLPSVRRLNLGGPYHPGTDLMPALMALWTQSSLQYLALEDSILNEDCMEALAMLLQRSKTLASVRLPVIHMDGELERLAAASQQNTSLRYLTVQDHEELAEGARQLPFLWALVERVAHNRQRFLERKFPLMQAGMKVLLGHLSEVDVQMFPNDVARYAAEMAVARNGEEAMALTLLNREAHQKGLEALRKLEGSKGS